jgi:serine/threonine protein kinase
MLLAPEEPERSETKTQIRSLRGEDAQLVVDLLQRTSDHLRDSAPEHPLRSPMRRLLINLSKDSDCLSSQLELDLQVNLSSMSPFAGGGYADTFDHEMAGTPVCIKRLRLHVLSTAEERDVVKRSLCREAMTARQFDHRNVLQLIGVWRPYVMCLCIVTPKITPGNLLDYQKSPFRADPMGVDPLPLLSQAMDGLLYLHNENFVHGDMKAANVLVDQDGHVFLCDYGFTAFGDATSSIQTNTEGGTITRTPPEYLFPQHFGLDNRLRTKAGDIYACAMLFLEAYTLKEPFLPEKEIDLIYRVVVRERRPHPPTLQECHGRLLPPKLWQLMERCWAAASADRPATEEVRDNLIDLSRNQVIQPIPV